MKKSLLSSDKKSMKRNAFSNSVALSFVSILCCAVCLMGVTWAWFTSSAAVRTNEIKTADFETVYTVTDEDGNPVEPVNGKYVFDKTVKYKVTVTGYGTASTGFAVFSVEDENVIYHSVQLNPKDENENSISFYVRGYSPLIVKDGNWGTSSQQDNVFDGDPRFIKNPVKLVPANENSTAVIERDGKVETWQTLDTAPYGIDADNIILPNEEPYRADSFESYYVYGLKTGLKVSEISDYVTVTGDGTFTVCDSNGNKLSDNSYAGTGMVIKVYDGETQVEEFYLVIYGDIDGDSSVTTQDISRIKSEINTKTWSKPESRIGYLFKAANLDLDAVISQQDTARLKQVTNKALTIDQRTGKTS